jgi:2-iminobutanoate/2-iminopropanoate deaminase
MPKPDFTSLRSACLSLLLIFLIGSCTLDVEQTPPTNDRTSEREIISTEQAPAAIGVYSQGVKIGSTIYVSGQIGLVPEIGQLAGEDLESQVRQTLANIEAILNAGGLALEDVVSAQVFLSDLNDYQAFNGIYVDYFEYNPPARMVVEVSRIPRDAKIEIMVTASR